MADKTLLELDPIPDPIVDTDEIYIVRPGPQPNYHRAAVSQLLAIIPASGTVTQVTSANGNATVANQTTTPDITIVSAPKLETARNINGVAFDGTANVTIQVPVATGITGLGTNVATALAVNVGSAGAPVVQNGALGTPSSGVATNLTGIPAGQVVGVIPIPNLATGTPDGTKFIRDDGTLAVPAGSGTVTSVASANGDLTVSTPSPNPVLTVVSAPKLTTARNINGVAFDGTGNITVTVPVATGITGLGTGVATALAVNVGSTGAPVVQNGALGTPSSGTATNLTGLPISTGVSGLGTGVATFLATPSSANLAAALTDETGSGAAVFATSPTLVTPVIGVATGTSLTLTDGDVTNNVPQNSQSAAYTTVLADRGKDIYHPVGDNNARTFTIDSNANVAYALETVILFTNMAAAAVTIAITSDTLVWAPTGGTGSRTLAQYGTASARKITSTSWLLTGVGVT